MDHNMDHNLGMLIIGLSIMFFGSLFLVKLGKEGKTERQPVRAYTGEEEHRLDYMWMLKHGRQS